MSEYSTVDLVKSRVGVTNIPDDVHDNEILQWIKEASNFIDLSTKKLGVGFQNTDALYDTVQQIVTDLSVIKLLLRMSGSGKSTTAGISYKIGEFSVDKKNIESSYIKEVQLYEQSAINSLETLNKYLNIDNKGFVGGSVIEGAPAPSTNYGDNSPQQP